MKYLFFLLLLLGITAKVSAQDMMLNGSFEDYDGNPDGDTDPSTISYAAYWRNLIGTSDLVHPSMIVDMSGTPCFGGGCGRFGVPASTGSPEYFYGRTLPLTAGQIYEVSFWVRKDSPTDVNKPIGMVMSETVPTNSIVSATPLILFTPESTQCVKVKTCFTAEHSVTHYLTFGPYNGFGSGEDIVYIIDSVSVMTIPSTTPLATANLTVSQSVICAGGQVTLNGTASANETSYEWNIYNTTNGNNLFYSSGIIQGTAGTLTPTLSFPIPGSCYRAELTVYGVCKDVSTVEFCIANPNIDFIFDGNPVCENTPVYLQVTGDNGWIYTWSQGNDTLANGTGIQQLTVTPTMGNGIYTVTVTTPEGCTHTESLHLNVNTHDNLPPWMDGINGTGEYTYYVRQGDAVFFNSVLSNDYSNELMDIDEYSTIPSGYIVNQPQTWGSVLSLSWVTSLNTSLGEYHYILTVSDQNACGADTSEFDFRIVVICDQCPVCLNYEDRTPSGTPLPPETKAGKCIEAGLNQIVSTGNANVLFQAGAYITEGPYFDAGPGYEGIIEPTTCISDCEDCCTDWNGFTYDEIPNPFYMNLDDSDPTNNFVQITDVNHPFCAFSAKGYKFEVLDNHSGLMNNVFPYVQYSTTCCPFESPAPENPIPHSPIWWDGLTQDPFGGLHFAHSQVYTYKLTLYGCNGEELLVHGNIHLYRDNNGMIQNPNADKTTTLPNEFLTTEQQNELEEARAAREKLNGILTLFPNPTTGTVQIKGLESEDLHYQVFDDKGIMLSRKEKAVNQSFSLTDYSKGTYYIRIYSGATYAVRKVVKM